MKSIAQDAAEPNPYQHSPKAAPRPRHPVGYPRDRYGLRLSTTAEAAEAFRLGMDRVLLLREGAMAQFARAVALDPGFVLGHATLALLGAEWGAAVDVPAALAAARAGARGIDERERSFVAAVAARAADPVGSDQDSPGARALLRHIADHPLDALAVSAAVPTVAFGGITSGRGTWELVEGLGSSYGDDWWYCGELAFVRQEQGRWDEAEELAVRSLGEQPAAGHAVHARTHVFYETGRHEAGLRWLDGWIAEHGPRANSGAHFSWHAAIHELALDDSKAVWRRYECQLAPPLVTGTRALVDSGSLLWRCRMVSRWRGPVPAEELMDAARTEWTCAPPNPFAALHGALALALAGDSAGLAALHRWAGRHTRPVFQEVVAPLCGGLCAVLEERWDDAVGLLSLLLPRRGELNCSLAQAEVIEETAVYAMIRAGQTARAARAIAARLDRRPSALDRARITALRPQSAAA